MMKNLAIAMAAALTFAVMPTAYAAGPTPSPEPARDMTFSQAAPAAVAGCYGHATTPEYAASLRNVYVQGYGQCSQPMDIQIFTYAQVYKKVNGVWKWTNVKMFYGHAISIRVWALGTVPCQTTAFRHWRTYSQGIVNGVSSTPATSFEAVIPC